MAEIYFTLKTTCLVIGLIVIAIATIITILENFRR